MDSDGRATVTVRLTFDGLTQVQADELAARLVDGGNIQSDVCDHAAALGLGGVGVSAEVAPADLRLDWTLTAGGRVSNFNCTVANALVYAAGKSLLFREAKLENGEGLSLVVRA
jgi:xanthine/CO dehydrogenase XdhC/CoxF family maturation factor